MKKLITKIDEVQWLREQSNKLEEVDEAKADKLYAKAYELNQQVAQEIVKIVKGKLDIETVSMMIWQYSDKIKDILNRAA